MKRLVLGRWGGAVGRGFCLLALGLLVAWIVLNWWLTGVILDWADDRFRLGLVGGAKIAVHIAMFLVLWALLLRGGSAAKK